MTEIDLETLTKEAEKLSFFEAHRFWAMILGALGIAFFLVLIAMNLYNSSGTAQLDLSRPEYENVRDQVSRDSDAVSYPAVGELNEQSLEQFRTLFNEKSTKLQEGKYFSPSAMTDEALGLPEID